MILRQFLYLSSNLTRQFLAQIEGGVYSTQGERLREMYGKERGGELGASAFGARVGFKAGRTSGGEGEIERTVELTPEAEFSRLHDVLTAEGAIRTLEPLDDKVWSKVRRGELVEAEAGISVFTIARYSNLVEQIGPLMELMQAMGEAVDEETKTAMRGIGMMGNIFGSSVPVTAQSAADSAYKFAANLDASDLRTASDQIDGDATILGKVQRKLEANESYTVFDLMPGLRGLPREQRRELESDLANSAEFPDMVISGPLAVLTAVAIYR